eukprot:2063036-Pleurochrysis_carterae.AAC.1
MDARIYVHTEKRRSVGFSEYAVHARVAKTATSLGSTSKCLHKNVCGKHLREFKSTAVAAVHMHSQNTAK